MQPPKAQWRPEGRTRSPAARDHLKALIDSLFGVRWESYRTRLTPDDFLKPLVVLLIVLWCGPEVFAVMELTTLLELLGATLFLVAFTTSFKLLALSILDWMGRAFLPIEYRALIRMSAGPGAVLIGLRLVVFNTVVLFVACFFPYAILQLLSNA